MDDLDTTLEGDDPVNLVQRAPSLIGGQSTTPERRHSSLVSGSNVTEVQLRSLNDDRYVIPERRHSSLAGSLQTTEEQRYPTVTVVCLQSESTSGYRPHSSHVSADGSCSDSVNYTQVQQMMDLVRDLTEDDDDVIHPTWRQLVQASNGCRKSGSYYTGPCDPAEKCDNTSTGEVCIQGPPVKQTRDRGGAGKYTGGQVDNTHEACEYRSRSRNEEVSNGSDPVNCVFGTVSELAHEGRMNENSRGSDSYDPVNMESTQILQLAPNDVGAV